MRAGTRMPGFSLGGISQMQSPAGVTFIAGIVTGTGGTLPSQESEATVPSDVDHELGPPAAVDGGHREPVEGHGLGVGPQGRARPIDHAAVHVRLQPERAVPADPNPRLW